MNDARKLLLLPQLDANAHDQLAAHATTIREESHPAGGTDKIYTLPDGSEIALGAHTNYAGNAREYPVRSDLTEAGRAIVAGDLITSSEAADIAGIKPGTFR